MLKNTCTQFRLFIQAFGHALTRNSFLSLSLSKSILLAHTFKYAWQTLDVLYANDYQREFITKPGKWMLMNGITCTKTFLNVSNSNSKTQVDHDVDETLLRVLSPSLSVKTCPGWNGKCFYKSESFEFDVFFLTLKFPRLTVIPTAKFVCKIQTA